MKVILEEDKVIVFLNHLYEKVDKENLEGKLKNLFIQLEYRYHLDMNGYYEIDVYQDKYYGTILELNSIDIDYYHFFSQVDMKINMIKNSEFLYRVEYGSLDSTILKKCVCYQEEDAIYLKLNEELSDSEFAILLEQARIVYGLPAKNIMKYSKKVKL